MNQPLDMIALPLRRRRVPAGLQLPAPAALKIPAASIAGQEPLVTPSEPIGVPRVELDHDGVSLMDNLGPTQVVFPPLQRDPGGNLGLHTYDTALALSALRVAWSSDGGDPDSLIVIRLVRGGTRGPTGSGRRRIGTTVRCGTRGRGVAQPTGCHPDGQGVPGQRETPLLLSSTRVRRRPGVCLLRRPAQRCPIRLVSSVGTHPAVARRHTEHRGNSNPSDGTHDPAEHAAALRPVLRPGWSEGSPILRSGSAT